MNDTGPTAARRAAHRLLAALVATTALWAPLGVVEGQGLPTATSTTFSGSGNCESCHSALNGALVDSTGLDVAPPTDWRATMMANAAKDPLWQAKVEAEVAARPELAAEIEDICTRCHAPMGNEQHHRDGLGHYDLDTMRSSALALDGVSCTLCHQIDPESLGSAESFSGGFEIGSDRLIYGPYQGVFTGPMQSVVNYTPVYGAHMDSSTLCATCHTLFTPVLDEGGAVVGTFPEQTPYLEWLDSDYPTEDVGCQDCHMRRLDEALRISNRPAFVEERSPFFRHTFVGGNAFMLRMLRDHSAELGVTAAPEHFARTLAATEELLRERTVSLDVEASPVEDGVLRLRVAVENLAGHKFPTSYPSRRAWLHVVARDAAGDSVFASGAWDEEGRLADVDGVDEGYQPHHTTITGSEQVQVWEAVMVDRSGARTWTLLEAARYEKDNRIPPRGFLEDVTGYEDIAVLGAAATDPDFNRAGDVEGTGTDTTVYELDVAGRTGPFTVDIEVRYQSVPPAFVADILRHGTAAGERFAGFWSSADKTPELVASAQVVVEDTGSPILFRRADADGNGALQVTDAIVILNALFIDGAPLPCDDAADADDSGLLNITDGVYTLLHLFSHGRPPPPPHPDCGVDPTFDELDCEDGGACR